MYAVYSFFLLIALTLYLPIYVFKTKILKKRGVFLRERLALGLVPRTSSAPAIWIHAVSVGEVISLQNLVREIRKRHPGWEIHFSTLTDTGYDIAREKLADADSVFFVPLDFRRTVRRVLKALKPNLLILAESEFWPNLIREAKSAGLGVILVNGRMSDLSYKKYGELKPFAKKLLSYVDRFLVQTDPDGEKLALLGVDKNRIETAGNLKTEVHLPDFSPEDLEKFRETLGISGSGKVIVAGSTRKGEEERLLRAFVRAKTEMKDLRFILAPRHIERAVEIEKAAQAHGLKTARRTNPGPSADWDVLILDTIGELARVYAVSSAAFVGGSLVDWGGHNILEPAYYAKPVFFGPHMQNFAYLADSFVQAGGARIVRTDDELEEMFLLRRDDELRAMGLKAKSHLAGLGGATERTIRVIERILDGKPAPSDGADERSAVLR